MTTIRNSGYTAKPSIVALAKNMTTMNAKANLQVVSTVSTLWTGTGFNYTAIEAAALQAAIWGQKAYLHVSFQKLLNNGVEDPSKPFRHDWRFTGGGSCAFEIEPGFAGIQNALAKAMIELACSGEGMVNFPCMYGVSTSPDTCDW